MPIGILFMQSHGRMSFARCMYVSEPKIARSQVFCCSAVLTWCGVLGVRTSPPCLRNTGLDSGNLSSVYLNCCSCVASPLMLSMYTDILRCSACGAPVLLICEFAVDGNVSCGALVLLFCEFAVSGGVFCVDGFDTGGGDEFAVRVSNGGEAGGGVV